LFRERSLVALSARDAYGRFLVFTVRIKLVGKGQQRVDLSCYRRRRGMTALCAQATAGVDVKEPLQIAAWLAR
jgi:hypothetical protein